VEKLFLGIPSDAIRLGVRFDIYRFESWSSLDTVKIQFNGGKIFSLGDLNDSSFGTQSGINWSRTAIGSDLLNLNGFGGGDQIHHVSMVIPRNLFNSTSIKVKIFSDSNGNDVFFGIDNFELLSLNDCHCSPTKVVFEEDFENLKNNSQFLPLNNWLNGKLDSAPMFSSFLGKYSVDDFIKKLTPIIIIDVPSEALNVLLSFDFYEIDDWVNGTVTVGVNDDRINLGTFDSVNTELSRSGTSNRGISWTKTGMTAMDMGFSSTFDQVHRVTLRIPNSIIASGQIVLNLECDSNVASGFGGFDNLVVVAEQNCNSLQQLSDVSTGLGRSAGLGTDKRVSDSGCVVYEELFDDESQCSMGYFGDEHIHILDSNGASVTFKFTGHPFRDVILQEIKIWFLDPTKDFEDDIHQYCWSGMESNTEDSFFKQEFVAKCENGVAQINMSGGEDGTQFRQFVDVDDPECPLGFDSADFNPLKRCVWQFKVPCDCGKANSRELESHMRTESLSHESKCRSQSQVIDKHLMEVDKCVTSPPIDTLQILNQNQNTVTFSIHQKWKGCDAFDPVGWIATDYVNSFGDLICDTKTDIPCGEVAVYTAQCTDGIAVVDIYAFDTQRGLFGQQDKSDVSVPLACNSYGDSSKQCHFRYVLKCEPTLCNDDVIIQPGRRLGRHESSEKTFKGK